MDRDPVSCARFDGGQPDARAYLVYAGIRETSVYYLKIDEFTAKKEALVGEAVRVAGRVQHGTVQWDARTLDLRFTLGAFSAEGDAENDAAKGDEVTVPPMPVEYAGILPDMFAEGRDVIVQGVYHADGKFVADTILTSCPSKYEPEVPAS